MRRWRVVAVAGTLLAAGVVVPVAYAMTNDDALPKLPRPGREAPADLVAPDALVVKLAEGASSASITSRGAQITGEIAGTGYVRVRPGSGDPAQLVAALNADPAVEAAALDYPRHASRTPTDPYYAPFQGGYLSTVRMPEAWDRVSNAGGTIIAVIDTGVDASHPDLAGRVMPGYNAVNPGASAADIEGHGTFVAGIIAANANNGAGVAGVAWNTSILPVQVFSGAEAFDSDIAEGIVWAVDHGAAVINMSLGGPGFSPLLHDAVLYASAHNVVVVAASGNTGSGVPQYPAAFPEVLAVGATDAAGKLVDFSSWGDWLDLAAPGFGIVSTFPGNQYYIGDGTSFAAPIVSGVAALVRVQNPQLTALDVADRLRATARDAGPRGIDPYYGYGVLDAARALGAGPAPDFPHSPGTGEPSDVPVHPAAVLSPGAGGTVSVQGTFGVEGDIDWYRYDAPAAQRVTVSVSPATFDGAWGQNADPVLAVFDAGLGLVDIVDSPDPQATETLNVLVQAGASYIKVSNFNGAADTRTYTLTITTTNGAPLYADQYPLPIATVSQAIAGDVTGDGVPDVVAVGWGDHPANTASNKLVVLPGTGGGGLGEPISYPTGRTYTQSVAVLKINTDDRLDVVAVANNQLCLFIQQPDGTLAASGTIDAGLGSDLTARVKAADVDNDGDTDLVLGSNSAGLIILVHDDGAATFTVSKPPVSGMRSQFAVGDVTGDGQVDVVRGDQNTLRIYDGADGWSPIDYASPAEGAFIRDVTTGDATGDGRADVVTGMGNKVVVYPQAGDGTLAAPVLRDAVANATGVVVADIDGDGRQDVVVDHAGYPSVGVHLQQADHTLAAERVLNVSKDGFNAYDERLAAADLDGDGRVEVLVAGSPLSVLRSRVPTDLRELVWSVTPTERSDTAPLSTQPKVTFTADMDPSTVNDDSVQLRDGRTGAVVASTVSYDAGTRTATIQPATQLDKNKPYRIVVNGVASAAGEFQLWPFWSTFITVNTLPPPLTDVHLRGYNGTSVRATLTIPAGDLSEIIIRSSPGTTPPGSPTAGTAAYSGVDPSPLITGLAAGQTYSFTVWYRDRSGALSPSPVTATLHGATLSMQLTSGTSTVTPTQPLTFEATLTSPTGAVAGHQLSLLALCRGGATTWRPVATPTTNASGQVSAVVTETRPSCDYRWELAGEEISMGAVSSTVHVTSTLPVPGGPPPRDR